MPYVHKDGTVHLHPRTIIDDLTYRKDLSRQQKWQIRKRRQGRCTKCGAPVEPHNQLTEGAVVLSRHWQCDSCREVQNKVYNKGGLKGKPENDSEPPFKIEDFVD